MKRIWTDAMKQLLKIYYPKHGSKITLAIIKDRIPEFPFNRKEICVKAYRMGFAGMHKERTRFKKGRKSPFKGISRSVPHIVPYQYKKGHISPRELPIGSTKLQANGYWWIKIAQRPSKWTQWHKHLWEEANGPTPKGYCVWFLDNNPKHCYLENLTCTPIKEMIKAKVLIHNPKHQWKTV